MYRYSWATHRLSLSVWSHGVTWASGSNAQIKARGQWTMHYMYKSVSVERFGGFSTLPAQT